MLVVCGAALGQASAPQAGVSRELARGRAARISDVRYGLRYSVAAKAATIEGKETVRFVDGGVGDLAIDFRDGGLGLAALNGVALGTDEINGHLMLPGAALHKGENVLEVSFTANVAAAGKAVTRYTDRDDGNEYLYTLFVPMDASMAFVCFDQPDLKGRFSLEVSAPGRWTVIGNTSAEKVTGAGTDKDWVFGETRPISTYLFAFAAGPFEKIAGASGEPSLFVRRSQLARAKAEAPQVQAMAKRGIGWLETYFQQPFPFPKYDLVLIPGFPFGGMEHAGATFLNEDGVLFRTAPTESDYFRRNVLVLHETTHQWFGDLVTMRWFDDLWLKEGFAQYMAYKALARLEPAQNPWKHFYEEIKPAAYGIDETQGTTPIFQDIRNLKDAKSAYGAIVYQKAPAVLKQLDFYLGEENFRDGLRSYLKGHAYGNAEWADLVEAFAATGDKPVRAWAKAWILQRGMPEVTVNYSCSDSKITRLVLTQRDVLGGGLLWPIANQVLLISNVPDGSTNRINVQTLKVGWSGAMYDVPEGVGKPCPNLVFANEGDFGYGRFLLGAPDAEVAADLLLPNEAPPADPNCKDALCANPYAPHLGPPELWAAVSETFPLRHAMLWGALWENVHVARSAPSSYVQLVLKTLAMEQDESLNRIQGGRVAEAFHAYMTAKGRGALLPQMEALTRDRMLHAPTLGVRIVNFRSFTGLAETADARGTLKGLLAGSVAVPGMPLRPLDRWNLVGHLVAMNDADAGGLFAAEKEKDQSGEGQKYAYAVEAGKPSAEIKARYFAEYLDMKGTRQEDWMSQSLRPFNSWNQTGLTEPYLTRALDELAEIKVHRKIFFLGAWLGAFVDGQQSAEAQAAVHAWLARKDIDPDLRLKVLEVSDGLDRTVMIRQRYAH